MTPSHYIVNRWTKLATSRPIFEYDRSIHEDRSKLESENKLVLDAWAQLFQCMHMASTCKEKFLLILNACSSIEVKLANKEIEFHPPEPSNTKGCGNQIKGGKEKAMAQQQKRKRLCKVCMQYAYHDSHNCPTKSSS